MIYILLSLVVLSLQKDDFQINVQIKKMPKKTFNETKEVKQVESKSQKQLAEEQIHEILTYAPIVVTDGARVFKDPVVQSEVESSEPESTKESSSMSEDEEIVQKTKTNIQQKPVSLSELDDDESVKEDSIDSDSEDEQVHLLASEPETDDAVVNALLLLDSSEQIPAIEFIFKKGQGTIERYELLKELSNQDKISVSLMELDKICKMYRVCEDEPEIDFEIELSDSEDETYFKLDYDSDEDEIQFHHWEHYDDDDGKDSDNESDDIDDIDTEIKQSEIEMDTSISEQELEEDKLSEEQNNTVEIASLIQEQQPESIIIQPEQIIDLQVQDKQELTQSIETLIQQEPLNIADEQQQQQVQIEQEQQPIEQYQQTDIIQVAQQQDPDIIQIQFEDIIATINETIITPEVDINDTQPELTTPMLIINETIAQPQINSINIEQEIEKRVLQVQAKLQEQLEQQRIELEQLKQQKIDAELISIEKEKLRQNQEQIEKERLVLRRKAMEKQKAKVVELEFLQTKQQEEIQQDPVLIQSDQLIPYQVHQSQVKEVVEVFDKEDPRREEEKNFPDREMTDEEKAKARFSKRYPAKGVEEQPDSKPVELKKSVDDIFVIESLVSQVKNNIRTLDEYIEPDEEVADQKTEPEPQPQLEEEFEEQVNESKEQDVSLLQMSSHLQLKIFNCKDKYYGAHVEARKFVCGCSQYIYLLDEDSWYLSGVIDHYKQYEFLFEKLRKTVPLIYTGTSKTQICFASQHPQPIVVNDFLQSLMYSVDYKFLELPKVVTLDYFQLSYDSKGFHQFRMKMENDDLKQLPGISIQSIQAETTADSVNLLFTGYLNFSKQKLRFELTNNFGATRIDMLVINVVLPQDEAMTLALCSKVLTEEIAAQLKLYLRFKSGPQRITVRVQQTDRSFEISYSIQQ